MKVVVLSFYFPPDLSAGSFRNASLVAGLSTKLIGDDKVIVITTMPNRYSEFSASADELEINGNVEIRRIAVANHKSGILGQSLAFLQYAKFVSKNIEDCRDTIVFASSSRLMTAVLGAWIAKRKKWPLYVDIRDIFTEVLGDMESFKFGRLLALIFRRLERFVIRTASKVALASPGFVSYFDLIDSSKNYSVFTNGVDNVRASEKVDGTVFQNVKEILYAGNIGDGQGLHKIIPGIASRLGKEWQIKIIGSGGGRGILEQAISGLSNVSIEAPMARDLLLARYNSADVLFLHLNDYPSFRRVIPSKIFEYAATGKPIIAGVEGEAARFLLNNVENTVVFLPCSIEGFFAAFGQLKLRDFDRRKFIAEYDRRIITDKMVADILSLASAKCLGVI